MTSPRFACLLQREASELEREWLTLKEVAGQAEEPAAAAAMSVSANQDGSDWNRTQGKQQFEIIAAARKCDRTQPVGASEVESHYKGGCRRAGRGITMQSQDASIADSRRAGD